MLTKPTVMRTYSSRSSSKKKTTKKTAKLLRKQIPAPKREAFPTLHWPGRVFTVTGPLNIKPLGSDGPEPIGSTDEPKPIVSVTVTPLGSDDTEQAQAVNQAANQVEEVIDTLYKQQARTDNALKRAANAVDRLEAAGKAKQ